MGIVTAETLIKDVICAHPEASTVLERYGLGCASCLAAGMETLSSAAAVHDVPLDVLLDELNTLYPDPPGKES